MKKILLASTGLIAASMLATSPASAEGLQFKVGGKVQQYLGFVDQDAMPAPSRDFESVDVISDSEVYFSGSMKLDNGITVGGRIEVEGERGDAGTGDIQYAWFSSDSLGTLEVGEVYAITARMHHSAPDVGVGWNATAPVETWVQNGGANSRDWTQVDDSKDTKIQYISPSFSGFTVAAMWVPEYANLDGLRPKFGAPAAPAVPATATPAVPTITIQETWAVGAAYNGEYDGFSVGADVFYANSDYNMGRGVGMDADFWQAGLEIGFGGFTVAGSYFSDNDGAVDGDGFDYDAYSLGASYKTGPYGVSLSWFHNDDDEGPGADSDNDMVQFSGSYALGPGASLVGTIGWAEYEQGGVETNDGWMGVVGVKLSF